MPNNVNKLFNDWLRENPKLAYLYQTDAEFKAQCSVYRTALALAYYALKADEQSDTETIIEVLFKGLPNGSETS